MLCAAGCGRIDFDARVALDVNPPCTLGPWSTPRVQRTTNSPGTEYSPALSTDGLTVFFQSDRPGGQGGVDLWFATRPTIADDFGPATNAGPLNTSADELDPALSSDGLTLYFVSSAGTMDQLYRATRASLADAFGPASLVPELANVDIEGPALSPRGDELFFSQGTSPVNLMHATFDGVVFGGVTPIAELDTTPDQGYPCISGDGLDIYFETTRSDAAGDIWIAHRASVGAAFESASGVDVDLMGYDEGDPEISREGSTLIFDSDRPGSAVLGVPVVGPAPDLWMATRMCQ